MSANTSISWATKTWNPVVGCTSVSPACDSCYARTLHDMRHAAYQNGKLQNIPQYAKPFADVQLMPDRILDPLSWRKPEVVFVDSMSDLFHKDVPVDFIDMVMRTIALARRHVFMILTKRPARMHHYFGGLAVNEMDRDARIGAVAWPLPNLMLGVTAENQETADQRIPMLLETPAKWRFISCEPLLGPIDLLRMPYPGNHHDWLTGERADAGGHTVDAHLDLVIVGGEQAKSPRPMHPDWASALRNQCVGAGVAFHFKQWGSMAPIYDRDIEDPDWSRCYDVDKKHPRGRWVNLAGGHGFHGARVVFMDRKGDAGRELDGRTWNEFPPVLDARQSLADAHGYAA